MKRMLSMVVALSLIVLPAVLEAKVITRIVEYRDGDVVLEGYLAYEKGKKSLRPGVLVVHEWMGLNDFARRRAEKLADEGYVAFAVDMYGKGVRAKDAAEAAELAGKYKTDRQLMRSRILAGLEALKARPQVDPRRIAAIGYCFGGTTVLELARSGAEVGGVVSFHGGLDAPIPAVPGQIRAKVLVLHGADDPLVPPEQVSAFESEMRNAGADWQLVSYGGAVHSFTNPEANDRARGVAYDERANKRSWKAMEEFLDEIF